jgi:hypothetical protein
MNQKIQNKTKTTKLELVPINHIVFVIDESGSMKPHRGTVERVFDEQVKALASRSVESNQETRVSLYLFNNTTMGHNIRCVVYDRDVLRLPSLKGQYDPEGGTPLVRATLQALADLSQTPELHADHAFLLYTITDGEETEKLASLNSLLRQRIDDLQQKENWTIAALVPDIKGVAYCRSLGFSDGNIMKWDVSNVEEVGAAVAQSTQSYMTMRAAGKRSTRGLFTAEVKAKRKDVVASLLPVTNPYSVFVLPTTSPRQEIRNFVEAKTGKTYLVGSAFYQLIKPETLQANKKICLRTVPDGRLFSGTLEQVRQVLNLPSGGDIKVAPGEIKDFVVFIESTSTNRHVIPGQEILVMKL